MRAVTRPLAGVESLSSAAAGSRNANIELGNLTICPGERQVRSDAATVTVEPLVMQLLVLLSRRAGQLVSRRDIFAECWGESPVGEDSLNRIVAIARKVLTQTAGAGIRIETVPGAGYVLRLSGDDAAATPDQSRAAIDAAVDSWRMGLPEPDHLRLELLRRACLQESGNALAWGMLALLARHAAEYDTAPAVQHHVSECERAAARALALDPAQPEARTALICVVPLFGRWAEGRRQLQKILGGAPNCFAAREELAVLEMATGRVRASMEMRAQLLSADPLAACYSHKAIYQLWSIGRITEMDHVGDRAMQLWPSHPAIWMARLWSLAYTDRVAAAGAMVEDSTTRPAMPAPALEFLRQVFRGLAECSNAAREHIVAASHGAARTGPANALAAMFALSLIDRRDDVFSLAEAYYLRAGNAPVPIGHTSAEPSLNEQHRRVTQILFTPVFDKWRHEDRFLSLCDRIGLNDYWEQTGLVPDFLAD